MEQAELISIIAPVKNEEQFIESCLLSTIAQSYQNWELIVCDDNSNDNTFDIIAKYADSDDRIKPLKNPGKGILDALNFAYSRANGTYVTRMDGDDLMPSWKLSTLKTLLDQSGKKSVATGKVKYTGEGGVNDGFKNYENWLNGLCNSNLQYSEIYKECPIASPAWMMYKSEFDNIGGFGSNYPEDYDLVFRMRENKIKVSSSSEIVHIWRDHDNRASRNDPNYKDNFFLDLKIKYLQKELKSTDHIVLWGAGNKGKRVCKALQAIDIYPTWICESENKIGHNIYNIILQSPSSVSFHESTVLVAVSNREEQNQIKSALDQSSIKDSHFLC